MGYSMINRSNLRKTVSISIGVLLCLIFYSYGQLPTAKIAVTQGKLDSICGTHDIKVVFTCHNTGYFVDFSDPVPRITRLEGMTNVFFPVISSDGNWITYQTVAEVEGPSVNPASARVWFRELAAEGTPIKIADTGYVPRFVQNTPHDTPAIVYATSVECPQQSCYTAGRTIKRTIVDKVPRSPETVFDGGSYYGGLSWDNRYLITGWPGGPNGFMLDIRNSGEGPKKVHSMRVKKNGTDIDTFVSIGTCNISRSASRIFTNTMLYYDFGSGALNSANCYHPLLGSWKEHALLFISRYDGEDLKVFTLPAEPKPVPAADAPGLGEMVGKEWYYPEWSNHPYYGIASLNIDRLWLWNDNWEHTYNNELIYMLDLKDSQYVKIIESTDTSFTSTTGFKYPYLWVKVPDVFREDSTWLATTIRERSDVLHPFRSRKGNILTEGISDTKITLFSLSGRKIATFRSDATLKNIRNTAGSGIFIINNGTPNNYVRFFNVR